MKEVNDRIERLIVRRLDGEITPDEELELDRELLRLPEARALLESYQAIDELSAEVIATCAGRPSADQPLRLVPSGRPPARTKRHSWMLYASALAAGLALVIIWRTPEAAPPQATPGEMQVARGSASPDRPTPKHVVPRVGESGGDVGVWRVADRPAQRLERFTDRNVILVPGRDGNVYLLNLDNVREVRQPTRQEMNRFGRDPI